MKLRRPALSALLLALAGCDPVETEVGAWYEEPNTALYLEAEDGMLSGGFTIAAAETASGGLAIVPPPDFASDVEPGPARARYEFDLDAGEYVLWGRVRTPDALHNRFFLQLDDGDWTLWRISVGDIWYWDDVHLNANYGTALSFSLSAGSHTLVVANAVDGTALDRLYVTARGDTPPGNDTPCDPPHSISVEGGCLPSCGSLNGTACGELECAGLPLLPAYDCAICCHLAP